MAEYKRKDAFHQKAKKEGYRSRAAYKLIELNKKHRFLRHGTRVIDLGCWPGGWLQVAAKAVGKSGVVVGVDLKETDSLRFSNVHLVEGDVMDEEVLKKCTAFSGGTFHVVLSDMSPKHTGIRQVDQAQTAHVVSLAFNTAKEILSPGGTLIVKAFPSNDVEVIIKEMRKSFNELKRTVLKSTRKSSKEFYIICKGYIS